jgi:RNA polymerase sigma factor (sigma-70 family)
MNEPTLLTTLEALPDAHLWSAATAGDTDAFGAIVSRYQSLVCAVTYGRVGDLSLSQDLAQETFVLAWRRLASLREPEQLRAWLCGIARTLAANARRRSARRGGQAVALAAIAEPGTSVASPLERLIAEDEQALLDRALLELPETYREVLVLFYREERSVAAVAAQLGVREEAVRQRLSRGRRRLAAEVEARVESALRRSRPTASFTAAVLAAVAVTGTASASSLSTLAVGGSAAKVGAGLSAGAVVGPAFGLGAAWLASKLVRAGARSPEEARAIGRFFRLGIGFAVGMVALLLLGLWLGHDRLEAAPVAVAVGTTLWTLALLAGFFRLERPMRRELAAIRARTGTTDAELAPQLAERGLGKPGPRRWATRTKLFGLPLFAFASGGLELGTTETRGARGWIAVGDLAISPLLALGGVAIAPIAVGGLTVGALSLSVGGLALGAIALGSLAFGWTAFGVVAVGWKGAYGASAIAHDFALGSGARALEANTAEAQAWFSNQWFTAPIGLFAGAIPLLVGLAIVVPLGLLARRAYRLRKGRSGESKPPTVARDEAPTERLHGLDALRAVALLLGLVLHSAMPYVLPPGFWAVGTSAPVGFLGWLAYYLHSFRLEVFFLLAGFFGALIVAKRGVGGWLRDRARRILLVFVVALYPMKVVLAALWIWGGRVSGWLTLPPEVASLPLWQLALGSLLEERWPAIRTTHLWFLYYLSILVGLWALGRWGLERLGWRAAWAEAGRRGLGALLDSRFAALGLAIVTTPLLTLMTGPDIDTPDASFAWHLPVLALYGFYFALGWLLCGARERLPRLAERWRGPLLGGLALSVVGATLVGIRLQASPWALENALALRWGSAALTSLVMALSVLGWLGVFLRFVDRPSSTVSALAAASYWIYVLHLPVMVALQVATTGLGLPWWLQVPLLNGTTLALTFGSYQLGRRLFR